MAFSMALRTPTPLNSTDPQCEQWGEYTTKNSAIPSRVPVVAAKSARGSDGFGFPVAAQVGTAGFAGGFDLFVGPYVGLRGLHVFPGAGNLAFVTLGESLVHTLDYTCGKLEPLCCAPVFCFSTLTGGFTTVQSVGAEFDADLRAPLSTPAKPPENQRCSRGQHPGRGFRRSACKDDVVAGQIEVR